MNVRITDSRTLASISPLEVATYLRSAGWTIAGKGFEAGAVWKKNDERVLLPSDATFADYPRRIAELLNHLAQDERRSQFAILNDIATSSSDVIRLRVFSSASDGGSVGIEQGVVIVQSAKDLMLACARSAVEPRPFFRSRPPAPAEEFLRRVRLGQTEVGSYVVKLFCPVDPDLSMGGDPEQVDAEVPFARRVTKLFADATERSSQAARSSALERTDKFFTDPETVQSGVSANFCSAIAEIGQYFEEGTVELSFSWARCRNPPTFGRRSVTFSSDLFPVLREGAAALRKLAILEDFEICGPVTRLDSHDAPSGGEVLIFAQVDTMRYVRTRLDAPQYDDALRAHKEGRQVSCRGRLKKEGRYYTMNDVRDFSVQQELF